MRTVKIDKYTVVLYDSIDELPIKRFHKFNKYMLVDAGIGSDLNDINERINKIVMYLDKDTKNARTELENLRQSLYLISEGTNIKHLSVVLLIESINGEKVLDLSDENIKRISKKLNNVSKGFLDQLLSIVKKKIDDEIGMYFPSQFDDAQVKEYYDRLKNKILLQLDTLKSEVNHDKEIGEIDDFLMSLSKPKTFSGKNSVEIRYDKQFDEMCLFLKKELSVEPANMSVLEFYNAFEYVKKLRKESNSKKK